MSRWIHRFALSVAVIASCGLLSSSRAHADERDRDDRNGSWFTAWSVAIGHRMGTAFPSPNYAPDVSNSSLRMIVRPSIAGKAIRVRIENTQALTEVKFGTAFIGKLGTGSSVVAGTNERLTFNGSPSLTLAAGASAWSDPIRFRVEAFERLAVSLDVISAVEISGHQLGLTTNYMGAFGKAGSDSDASFVPVPENVGTYPFYYVAAIDVKSSTATGTFVAFGDSITDGRCSTRDPVTGFIAADQYNRWPDVVSQRLHALYGRRAPALTVEAIAGNRVVVPNGNGPTALVRLQNDVLERSNLVGVIFFEGTNDIAYGGTAAELIAGIQEIIDRVHAKGVPIYGSTIAPRGRPAPMTLWDATMEQHRLVVNNWIRTQAKFDGLIEFGALLSGPIVIETDGLPAETLWDAYNCFDYIHPNKTGYEVMGNKVDLNIFNPVQQCR